MRALAAGWWWKGAAVAIILAISVIGAAHAADMPSLPPPDPPGVVAVVTPDAATTTSRCIGQVSTPVCTFETLQACRARDDKRLCALFDPDLEAFLRENPGYADLTRHTTTVRYRIRSVLTLGPQDGDKVDTQDVPIIVTPWQPGDVLIYFEQKADDAPWRVKGTHLFHHDGDRWVLVYGRLVPPAGQSPQP